MPAYHVRFSPVDQLIGQSVRACSARGPKLHEFPLFPAVGPPRPRLRMRIDGTSGNYGNGRRAYSSRTWSSQRNLVLFDKRDLAVKRPYPNWLICRSALASVVFDFGRRELRIRQWSCRSGMRAAPGRYACLICGCRATIRGCSAGRRFAQRKKRRSYPQTGDLRAPSIARKAIHSLCAGLRLRTEVPDALQIVRAEP